MTWIKGLAWTLLGLIALAAIGTLMLTRFVDPDRFRNDIEAAVRNATGRELKLKGRLELSWYPWLAVTTGDGQIAGAAGQPPLIGWQSARVGARLLPLLSGTLEIDRIRADGLALYLHRDANGRANWDSDPTPAANSRKDRPTTIAGLDLKDLRVEFIDERKGTRWQACRANLSTSALAGDLPVTAKGRVTLNPADATVCSGGMPLEWQTEFRTNKSGFEVRDVLLSLVASKIKLAIPSLSVDTKAQTYRAASWDLQVAQGRIRGGPLQVDLSGDTQLTTALTAEKLSPRELAAAFGVQLPRSRDASVLGSMTGVAQISWRGGAGEFRSEQLQLDDSRLQGYLRRGPAPASPWEFQWQIDALRLERYLPPRDPAAPPFKFPSEDLRNLQARGHIKVKTLRWFDVVAHDAELVLEMRDGQLNTVSGAKP